MARKYDDDDDGLEHAEVAQIKLLILIAKDVKTVPVLQNLCTRANQV